VIMMELTDKEYFDISPFLTNVRRDKIIHALALEERLKKLNILYILGVLRLHENETPANEQAEILAGLRETLEDKE